MNKKIFNFKVFEKACLSRQFEEKVIENINNKNIKIPAYVSAGQEFIPSSIATICQKNASIDI